MHDVQRVYDSEAVTLSPLVNPPPACSTSEHIPLPTAHFFCLTFPISKSSRLIQPHLIMGQVIFGMRQCFGTSTSVDEPITSQQLPSRARGARVPSIQQSFTPVCRPMQKGRRRTSWKPGKESTLPNAPPTEGSANQPHSIQTLPPVASSSNGFRPSTSAGG